jgi:hypothetical protein
VPSLSVEEEARRGTGLRFPTLDRDSPSGAKAQFILRESTYELKLVPFTEAMQSAEACTLRFVCFRLYVEVYKKRGFVGIKGDEMREETR